MIECTLNLKTKPFDAILKGKKRIEIRAYKSQYEMLKPKDCLIVTNVDTNRKISCTILRITHYSSVRELLHKEGMETTLSNINDIEEGIKSIENIRDYKERIKKNGVFAIEIGDPILQ